MNAGLEPWTTQAINLSEHATNIIHTDAGAIAAGFPGALVAGTTVYAYMTHPPAAAWGLDWVAGGGGEVRLIQPVFDDDTVDCVIGGEGETSVVSATVDGDARATFAVWQSVTAPSIRTGAPLAAIELELDESWCDYGIRAGDDLALYSQMGVAHPAAWLMLANHVFMQHLVDGPWIHTRSKVFHQGLAALGDAIRIESVVVDRFTTRAGERALVDIAITANNAPVATIEHEAIVGLAGPD